MQALKFNITVHSKPNDKYEMHITFIFTPVFVHTHTQIVKIELDKLGASLVDLIGSSSILYQQSI
jgi:hypothetical protein